MERGSQELPGSGGLGLDARGCQSHRHGAADPRHVPQAGDRPLAPLGPKNAIVRGWGGELGGGWGGWGGGEWRGGGGGVL